MRSSLFRLLICFFFLTLSGRAQSQQSTTLTPAPQDPQAISVLNRALAVAGGTSVIKAIADYSAFGNVNYHWAQDVQGTVTVIGLWPGDIRSDANLPRGVRSWAIHDGETTTKAEDQTLSHVPPRERAIPSSDAFPYQAPMYPASLGFPYRFLVAVLNNPFLSMSYKGVVQIDGRSAHDVQVQQALPGQTVPDSMTEYHTKDLFIDAATLQLLMTQDNVPKHILHQVRYSDYRVVSGVLVPFSISEELGGQRTWEIQLSQISFNGGLQESAFVLQ